MSNKLREALGNIYMGEINGVAVYPQSVDSDSILDAVIEALPEDKVFQDDIYGDHMRHGYFCAINEVKSILEATKSDD